MDGERWIYGRTLNFHSERPGKLCGSKKCATLEGKLQVYSNLYGISVVKIVPALALLYETKKARGLSVPLGIIVNEIVVIFSSLPFF